MVTEVSRRYGVYRSTIYRWRDEITPQKPGPISKVFWQTDQEIEVLIIQLRLSTNYGPKRLKSELSDYSVIVGEKAIRGVIEDADMVKKQRKPRKKDSQPFYATYPGYRLQVDTKAVPKMEINVKVVDSSSQL